MPKLDRDQMRIVDLGRALFGASWQGQFARMTGLSRPYVSLIARGDRPVTQTVVVAVTEGLRTEAKRLRARAAAVAALSSTYEHQVFSPDYCRNNAGE